MEYSSIKLERSMKLSTFVKSTKFLKFGNDSYETAQTVMKVPDLHDSGFLLQWGQGGATKTTFAP